MTFSKGYWATILSKVCYGLFLAAIPSKILDILDRMHVDIARNGTQHTNYSDIGRHELADIINTSSSK